MNDKEIKEMEEKAINTFKYLETELETKGRSIEITTDELIHIKTILALLEKQQEDIKILKSGLAIIYNLTIGKK